jgi:hypothetical protein
MTKARGARPGSGQAQGAYGRLSAVYEFDATDAGSWVDYAIDRLHDAV